MASLNTLLRSILLLFGFLVYFEENGEFNVLYSLISMLSNMKGNICTHKRQSCSFVCSVLSLCVRPLVPRSITLCTQGGRV